MKATDGNEGFFKDLDKLMQFPKEGIFSTVLSKGERYSFTLMCLSAGTDIDEHTSTKPGAVIVLKGTGTFWLNEKEIALSQGMFIFMPANSPHSLRAIEDLAILLVLM